MEQAVIYLVEDDASIASLIQEHLGRWGMNTVCCHDFSAVDRECAALDPQLVLLDISLPCYNGYYWCAEIRKHSNVPILFLSSHNENMDIVMAVNLGGDDYITKPFSVEVLAAKITALLRRTYRYPASDSAVLCAKGAELSAESGKLEFAGQSIDLTKNELRILHTLLLNKNAIVSRSTIMNALWDSDSFIDDNTLTVNVNRLRAKLEDAGLANFITTRKGMGYVIYD